MDEADVRQWKALIDLFFAKRANIQEREDLQQEAWCRLMQRQEHDKPVTPQLVITVCRGVWVDHLRAQRRQGDNEQPLINDCGYVEWEQTTILRMDVQCALQQLSPEERELLLRHYVLGETCAELADALGVTKAAMKKRIQRAKARLRQYLPDYAGGGVDGEKESISAPGLAVGGDPVAVAE
ncbi:MAG: RNA polymerase sigma factor [Armatimonadota bacterium]